jgi:hypothetical protein
MVKKLDKLDKLEDPPASGDPFFWTDFAELRAIVHPDRCFSRGDLVGLSQRNRDISGDSSGEIAGERSSSQRRWRDLIDFAGARRVEFGSAYPFAISDDGDTLDFSYSEQNSEQITYLRLLLAALMRHLPKCRIHEVGRYFEEASFAVFSRLMPEGAEVRPTWAQGGAEASYQGTLFQKMTRMAADLRCTANFKDRDFKENDRGDGGIDIISWHPMEDQRPGIPIAFAQCGCSTNDWTFKQLQASYAQHGTHFPVMHPWATYYFLPVDLRHADGGWAYESDIGHAIIVDRLRMIRLASKYRLHNTLPHMPLLDEVLAMRYA